MFKNIVLNLVYVALVFVVLSCVNTTNDSRINQLDTLSTNSNSLDTAHSIEPEAAVVVVPYDSTVTRARKQIDEILFAQKETRLKVLSYLYDNGSGEGIKKGTMFLAQMHDFDENKREWYLRLETEFAALEYFFDDDQSLFSIRLYKIKPENKLVGEIFYNKKGAILSGSWLQRYNEDKTDLYAYKGDYWYDFLEGWPLYRTVKQMKEDKSLKFQQ